MGKVTRMAEQRITARYAPTNTALTAAIDNMTDELLNDAPTARV